VEQRAGAVEGVVMNAGLWKNRRVLVTGHTGFKGSWLTLWLKELGADVSGIALDPRDELNHWDLLKLDIREHRADLRDAGAVAAVVEKEQPEIVFHLAAQALVRRSYRDPLETWSTNVMGAAHVLEACRHSPSVKSIVCITSDKCYENLEWARGYHEADRLGGIDPYSASKAAVELLADSYRRSWFEKAGVLLATTRAGNVIGGGDWSEDRLIPDVVRAAVEDRVLNIRSPNATRPWQHVLEPVSGYLMLGEKLLQGDARFAEAWNFGPDDETNQPVSVMLDIMKILWPAVRWQLDGAPQPHEAQLLHLDSTKSRARLGWRPVWNLNETLQATAGWYRSYHERGEVVTKAQLDAYRTAASGLQMEKAA
jgi:CDP-glucose 4,6-dehydratase